MGGQHGKIPPNDLRDLCNRTSFDEKELRTWHDKFKKEYPSGNITKQDFIQLYRGFYTTGDAKKFSEHVFRVFDANNDGKIASEQCVLRIEQRTKTKQHVPTSIRKKTNSIREQPPRIDFKEFVCALSVTTRGSMKEKLRWAFSIYDINGDGSISARELITIIKSIKVMADALDDQNVSDDKILQIFKSFDLNNDGVLTADEFMEGARKNPFLMNMLEDYVSN